MFLYDIAILSIYNRVIILKNKNTHRTYFKWTYLRIVLGKIKYASKIMNHSKRVDIIILKLMRNFRFRYCILYTKKFAELI